MNHVLPRHKSKGMQSSCTGAEATSTFSCRLRLWRGPVDVTELGVVERGRDLGAEAYVRKGVSDEWYSVAARGQGQRAAYDHRKRDRITGKRTTNCAHQFRSRALKKY